MAKKSKKPDTNPETKDQEAVPLSPIGGGLSIQVETAKQMLHGSMRLFVKVRLLQDGVEISCDEDYVVL